MGRAIIDSFLYYRTSGNVRGAPLWVRLLVSGRLCVLPMTFYAVSIGAALAALNGCFKFWVYAAVLAGFLLAHMADNLLNDYTDYSRGLDDPGYFRSLYGPHPLIDRLVSPGAVKAFVACVLAVDAVLAAYLSLTSTLVVGVLALLGLAVMAVYVGFLLDVKRLGLGEALVAVVWGPVMAGGTLAAMCGGLGGYWEALVYLSYAAAVSAVLIGKHMDKAPYDSLENVRTLPVRIGVRRAGVIAAAILLISPLTLAYAVYKLTGSPWSLAALAATLPSAAAAAALLREKPREKPRGWRVWPIWYVGWAFTGMDAIGRYTLSALLLPAHDLAHILGFIVLAVSLALDAIRIPYLTRALVTARLQRG